MMKTTPHPNRARALATARRSGFPVAKMHTLTPAARQTVMDSLNNGTAALITAPNGAQFVMPTTPGTPDAA